MCQESMFSNVSNRTSSLLNFEENKAIIDFLGPKCVSVAIGVVRYYKTNQPSHDSWEKICAVVVVLVRDSLRHSYFVQIINPITKEIYVDQELYSRFNFKTFKNHFISFEGDNHMIGLSFADEGEASTFKNILDEKLAAREQRRNNQKKSSGHLETKPVPVAAPTLTIVSNVIEVKSKKKGQTNAKSKIVISAPSEFRHVGHIGFDPVKGFDLNNVDPKWKTLFDHVGISETMLNDMESSKFIFDFVQERGGIDKAVMEIEESKKRPVVSNPSPLVASYSSAISSPMPVNSNSSSAVNSMPRPPTKSAPSAPPPQPQRMAPQARPPAVPKSLHHETSFPAPPPPSISKSISSAPIHSHSAPPSKTSIPSMDNVSAPPPPPPPPPPVMQAVAPPPMLPPKNVDAPSFLPSTSNVSDSSGDLLKQIRQGMNLKKCETIDKPVVKEAPAGIAGALASKLAEMRTKVVDDDDDDDECDIDEWDD